MVVHDHPRADLHIHSKYSDGTYSVTQIVEKATASELRAISITDHDTVRGIDEAIRLASESDLEIVPGVEFSSRCNDLSVHIMGYFLDHSNTVLKEYLALCEKRRLRRTETMISKLRKLGYNVSLEQVLRIADGAILGRPHVAAAVMETNEMPSMHAVFKNLLIRGKPAYVAKPTSDAAEIIELIRNIGGASSLAHPKTVGDDSIIPRLAQYGMNAIEVVHSSHSLRDIEKYSTLADQHGLVLSGGSDCHGERLGKEVMGRYTISLEQLERLRAEAKSTFQEESKSG